MYEFLYDNSLATVLALSLGAILLGLSLSRKRSLPPRSSDVYRTLAQDAMNRERIAYEKNIVENPFGSRKTGKLRELAAGYAPPLSKPRVFLSPRQIERVNIVRKQRGARPLNNIGIKSAVSAAWDTPRREPATNNEWLTYLIMYEVFAADHTQTHCAGAGGITIDPNLSYNGAGGEYAGAGASGDWTSAPAPVAAIASGIAVGASAAYLASHLEDSNLNSYKGDADPKYAPGDTVGGYGNSEVRSYQNNPDYAFDTPAPSAPDPSPASAPDPAPSGDGS